MIRRPIKHPALHAFDALCDRVKDGALHRDFETWRDQHIQCCGCESLLDKEAHGRMKPEQLQDILKHQAKNRLLELGRFAVEGAGITEEFDVGYAIGRATSLWVLL